MLKNLLITMFALSFIGCASSKKTEDAPAATPAAAPTAPVAKAEEAPKKDKKAKKEKAAKAESAPSDAKGLQCANGADKRSLEIKATDTKGCELHYTKASNTNTVATQVVGDEKCVEVLNKIKSNLEGSGFTCS